VSPKQPTRVPNVRIQGEVVSPCAAELRQSRAPWPLKLFVRAEQRSSGPICCPAKFSPARRMHLMPGCASPCGRSGGTSVMPRQDGSPTTVEVRFRRRCPHAHDGGRLVRAGCRPWPAERPLLAVAPGVTVPQGRRPAAVSPGATTLLIDLRAKTVLYPNSLFREDETCQASVGTFRPGRKLLGRQDRRITAPLP
jgi:hypothetical protein